MIPLDPKNKACNKPHLLRCGGHCFFDVMNRSKETIYKVVLYGENANLVKREIMDKLDLHCEIGSDIKELGVINNVWYLDVDDLVELYSRGSLNF